MKKYLVIVSILLTACGNIPYDQRKAIQTYDTHQAHNHDAKFTKIREYCRTQAITQVESKDHDKINAWEKNCLVERGQRTD